MIRFFGQFGANSRFFCLLIGIYFFVPGCVQQAIAQEDEESLKRRFLQDAPLQWEQYVRRVNSFHGRLVSRNKSDYRNTVIQAEYGYKANRNKKILTYVQHRSDNEAKQNLDYVFAINTKYAFKLQRKSASSPWLLTQLIDFGLGDEIPELFNHIFDSYSVLSTLSVRLHHDLLAEAVRQSTFRVTRIRSIQHNGEVLVEVLFDYPHEQNDKVPFNSEQSGRILLDPNRFWIMRSCDLKATNGTIKNTRFSTRLPMHSPSQQA